MELFIALGRSEWAQYEIGWDAKNKINNIPTLMEVTVYIWLAYYKKIISMWSIMTMQVLIPMLFNLCFFKSFF